MLIAKSLCIYLSLTVLNMCYCYLNNNINKTQELLCYFTYMMPRNCRWSFLCLMPFRFQKCNVALRIAFHLFPRGHAVRILKWTFSGISIDLQDFKLRFPNTFPLKTIIKLSQESCSGIDQLEVLKLIPSYGSKNSQEEIMYVGNLYKKIFCSSKH